MLKKIVFAILLVLGIGLTIGGLFSLGGDDTGAMIFMTVVGIVLILISSKPLFSDKKTKDDKAAKPGRNVDEQMARQVAEQIKNKSSDASGLLKNVADEESRRETLSYAIKMVVDEFLEDNLLSEEEEETINHFLDNAGYSTNALNAYGGITDLLKASALRSVMNGDIPENVPEFQMPIQFNFLKSETFIRAFGDGDYYKDLTRRHYEGSHQGFSVRVAKGLQYRTGAFKGRPVEEKNLEYQIPG